MLSSPLQLPDKERYKLNSNSLSLSDIAFPSYNSLKTINYVNFFNIILNFLIGFNICLRLMKIRLEHIVSLLFFSLVYYVNFKEKTGICL